MAAKHAAGHDAEIVCILYVDSMVARHLGCLLMDQGFFRRPAVSLYKRTREERRAENQDVEQGKWYQ